MEDKLKEAIALLKEAVDELENHQFIYYDDDDEYMDNNELVQLLMAKIEKYLNENNHS